MSKMVRVIAAVLVLGLALAACGGGSNDGGFSDEIRDQFMSGCEPGVGTEFCECALDELEQVYTEDEFIQVGLEAFTNDSEEVPDEVMTAVLACVDKIPGG